MYPLGELLILAIALFAWAENHRRKNLGFVLICVWVIGKILEGYFGWQQPWNINYSRLGVIAIFSFYSYRLAKRRLLPLILTSCTFLGQNLFLVNEPGIVPIENWIFSVMIFAVAWFSTQNYWSLAFTLSGSLLINQIITVFCYGGITRFFTLPDPFLWHFSVTVLILGGALNSLGKVTNVLSKVFTKFEQKDKDYEVEANLLEKNTEDFCNTIRE